MSTSKKRLKELEAIKYEDIDYSEIPELDEDFWRRAERHVPTPRPASRSGPTGTPLTGSSC